MKNLSKQFRINPITLTVIMSLFLFVGNSLVAPTQAQDSGTATVPAPFQNTTPDADNLCEPEMKDYASKELADFRSFIETNYQNKSSTASLMDTAMSKYRQLRTELNAAFAKYYPAVGSLQVTTGIEPSKCQQIITTTLSDARMLLKTHAVRTSGVKKSSAILEKYQQINAQLANLFQQFVYTKAYLDTFSTKLPCYPKTGCVKG
jgi:hypothetical protein